MTKETIQHFRRTVLGFYTRHGRDLPWRKTRDPYRILVSEVMLQQTQVPRVLPKYKDFLKRFPTIQSLARSRLKTVLRLWSGLGYNRRGHHLWQAARIVVDQYGGRITPDFQKLTSLPGIGDATANAVLAYAFNQPVTFIETNIRTVYLHHFFKDKAGITDDQLRPLIETTIDRRNPRRWYNALMDYGSYLKSAYPNPSRSSRHYVKQRAFKGSRRELRGLIVKMVLKSRRITQATLQRKLQVEKPRLTDAFQTLEDEGLIRLEHGVYRVG